MKVYLVAFETSVGRRVVLEDYLRRSKAWWHHLPGFFLVASEQSADDLAKDLLKFLHEANSLFIVEVNPAQFSGRLPSPAWDWLRSHAAAPAPAPEKAP